MILKLTAIIAAMLAPNPNHQVLKHDLAESVATQCNEAAEKYGQDPVELLTWAFYESSLLPSKVGKLGEVGFMQVHGVAAKLCIDAGEEPGTFACGAYLWSEGEKICGSHTRSLWLYASGGCDGTPRAKRIVKFRMRKAEQWRK